MTAALPVAAEAEAGRRLAIIDGLRGVAIVAMIVYHFSWDLTFFSLADIPLLTSPFWLSMRTSIVSAFLGIAGLSLVLATAQGLDRRRYVRRLALVAGCAGIITVATYFAIPDAFIFFGILHCIALSSVLGLAFVRLPAILLAALGLACWFAPAYLADPVFDQPWWRWLGLMTYEPRSNDYVPLLPWFGVFLIGMAFGRGLVFGRRAMAALGRLPVPGLLRWSGRNSLAIYMVHQPILIGLLFAWVSATGLGALPTSGQGPIDRVSLAEACRQECGRNGDAAEVCEAHCACAIADLDRAGLLEGRLAGSLSAPDRTAADQIVDTCLAAARATSATPP